jgi:predicted Zn-dependent peptidase
MPPETFHRTTLDNGLTIIGEHQPHAQSVAAGYFVTTGARDEEAELAGVSHFLEHMLFKGTARRSAEAINREFDELGANYNAFTSDERTVYYGAVLPERGAELLDLLTDMMRPALREGDFDLEKLVILEELAMYDDRPSFKVLEAGSRRYYGTHPLGNPVLGSPESIGALKLAQMLDYFERRYAADNLILAVAGRFGWDELVGQIKAATGRWQARGATRRPLPLSGARGVEVLARPHVKRVYAAAYAPGVSVKDPRRYAAAILASCLGDDAGSRLYWALVDPGRAESATLSHDAAFDLGTFVGYLSTAPEQAQEALERFRQVLVEVQEGGLDEAEWRRAQRKLATGLTIRAETPFGRLMSFGTHYQATGEYLMVRESVDYLLNTPLEAGQAILASHPFDQLFVTALGPDGVAL